MRSQNTYNVTWLINPSEPLRIASKVLSGLTELKAAGRLRLRFARMPTPISPDPLGSCWEVTQPSTGRTRRIFLDYHDASNLFNGLGLDFADVYYKRGFEPAETAKLGARGRVVHPFGLNFSCLVPGARVRLALIAMGKFMSDLRWRKPRAAWDALVYNGKLLSNLPVPTAFELAPEDRRVAKVIYQSRIWPPEESEDDLPGLNRERISLVRALKTGLGEQFVGGIRADWFSKQECPDITVSEGTHRQQFVRQARCIQVGIYTRGVHHSIGFKMAEYLAAGQCVVSPPFRHVLPQPLIAGVNYLEYTTDDECVEQCRRLLSDKQAADAMAAANYDFYKRWVAPAAHVQSLLDRAFEAPSRTGAA